MTRKSMASRSALLAMMMALAGCASTRFYPLCVFGPDPRITSDEMLRQQVGAFVESVAGSGSSVEVSTNERFVSVYAVTWGHSKLRDVWPRAACIGQTRYDSEYNEYKACVALIEAGLREKGIPPLGEWSDGIGNSTVYCQGYADGSVE